jgi:hypothetical protein
VNICKGCAGSLMMVSRLSERVAISSGCETALEVAQRRIESVKMLMDCATDLKNAPLVCANAFSDSA